MYVHKKHLPKYRQVFFFVQMKKSAYLAAFKSLYFSMDAFIFSIRFSGLGWVLLNSEGRLPPDAASRISITPLKPLGCSPIVSCI
jgi:hypothetical protein